MMELTLVSEPLTKGSDTMIDWQTKPQNELELAIIEFKAALPGWWYSVCECQVSCDASCAPTVESSDVNLIRKAGDHFDAGFHVDLLQPSTLAQALRTVMQQAISAIALAHAKEPPNA